jgi:hypothetical protein
MRFCYGRYACRQQHAGGGPHVGDTAGDTSTILGGGFHQIGDRAHKLAANGEALKQADADQQDRRPYPDGAVRRQQPDGDRSRAHQGYGEHQHELASLAVANPA